MRDTFTSKLADHAGVHVHDIQLTVTDVVTGRRARELRARMLQTTPTIDVVPFTPTMGPLDALLTKIALSPR